MDHALPFRRELIANATGRMLTPAEQAFIARARMNRKRAAAVAQMGDSWVLHENYNHALHPHHRHGHKHSAVLKPIADKARIEGRL